MKIALIIYLIIGIISNLLGPLAKVVKETVLDVKDPSRSNVNYEPPTISKRKVISLEITLRFLVLCFSPIGYAVLLKDHYNDLKKEHDYKIQEEMANKKKLKDIIDNKSFLFFKDTHGGGLISCPGCGFTQEIIGFTHGFDDPCPFSEGNQCQSCGKFQEIDFLGDKRGSPEKCSCGGKLSREEPIFCPKCKARDVSYQLTYMT